MVSIWKRLALTGTIVVAAVGTVGVAPASARGFAPPGAAPIPCQTRALSKAFSQWGDQNDYFAVTDGTFEAGAASWSLLGQAKVTSGEQAPWKVNGANHNSAMVLPERARASAPQTCLVVGEEYFRFFYRAPASRDAQLVVTVMASNSVAKLPYVVVLRGTGTAGWFVSPPIAIPNVRPASTFVAARIAANNAANPTARFAPPPPSEQFFQQVDISFRAAKGEWVVDDVMIDPFKVR
jgi:hypothetical protein